MRQTGPARLNFRTARMASVVSHNSTNKHRKNPFPSVFTMAIPPPPSVAESRNDAILDYKRFLIVFFQARGTAQILIVSTLLSLGIGSGIGLVRRCKVTRWLVACLFHEHLSFSYHDS